MTFCMCELFKSTNIVEKPAKSNLRVRRFLRYRDAAKDEEEEKHKEYQFKNKIKKIVVLWCGFPGFDCFFSLALAK